MRWFKPISLRAFKEVRWKTEVKLQAFDNNKRPVTEHHANPDSSTSRSPINCSYALSFLFCYSFRSSALSPQPQTRRNGSYFTPSFQGGSHSYQKMWDTSEHKRNLYLIHINERHWASWMENCQRERSTLIDYGLEWDDKDQSPLYTQNRKTLSGVNDWRDSASETKDFGKTVAAGRETEKRKLSHHSCW